MSIVETEGQNLHTNSHGSVVHVKLQVVLAVKIKRILNCSFVEYKKGFPAVCARQKKKRKIIQEVHDF